MKATQAQQTRRARATDRLSLPEVDQRVVRRVPPWAVKKEVYSLVMRFSWHSHESTDPSADAWWGNGTAGYSPCSELR